MIFYKIHVVVNYNEEAYRQLSANELREIESAKREFIAASTDIFNSEFDDRYIWTVHANKKFVTIVAICKKPIDDEFIKLYLDAIDMDYVQFKVEEEIFADLCLCIDQAARRGFLENSDIIYSKLNINRRRIYYDCREYVLKELLSESELFIECDNVLSKSLKEEVSRILKKSVPTSFLGHPVHYLIRTDNDEV